MVKGKLSRLSSGKANKPKKWRSYREISWHQCQCSGSSQIPCEDNLEVYHQYLSLYKVMRNGNRTELIIQDTRKRIVKLKVLDTKLILDEYTWITQLPNGELFCYGSYDSGNTLIIDKSYGVRMLPSGTHCSDSLALYLDNNIYCFGGRAKEFIIIDLSRKFDLKKNKWTNLTLIPQCDFFCHSLIFNGIILISGNNTKNIWLYSIEIDSFSRIPYEFARYKRKFMINVERLYLIEWGNNGLIYESEDKHHLKPISKSGQLGNCYYQIYCLYNKEKIYISTRFDYYIFDLKEKFCLRLKI